MGFASFSLWLEEATQPQHPYYHYHQAALFAGFSYIGTSCLTSISPIRGMTLTLLVYTISQVTAPFFSRPFEPYQEFPLVPLFTQVIQFTTSLILAKVICRLAGQSVSFKEIRQIGFAFFACLYVARWALLYFRQQLQPT